MPPSTRFAVNLDYDTDADFTLLTNRLGERIGRQQSYRGQRHASRADVLRALVTIAERNPHIEQAVEEQLRAQALAYADHDGVRGPAAEVLAVADELAHLSPSMGSSDSTEHLTGDVVPELRNLASTAPDRPIETAAFLDSSAKTIARHGAAYGGYTYGRPMQQLARRLQLVRDALDPHEKTICPRCAQMIRTTGRPGATTPNLEQHLDQAGNRCTALADEG